MTFSIVLHTATDFYIKKLCFLLFRLICCCFLFLLCFVSERGWMFLCKTRQNNYNWSGIMIQMNMILKIVSNVNRLKYISIPLWPNAEKVYKWKQNGYNIYRNIRAVILNILISNDICLMKLRIGTIPSEVFWKTCQAVSFHGINPKWPTVHVRMNWSLSYTSWVLLLNFGNDKGKQKAEILWWVHCECKSVQPY